jgi:hypothetical protein
LLAALDDEWANPGEIRNARAVVCLAEGDAGELGDQRAASPGGGTGLALAESDLDVLYGSSPAVT